jgi:hypothetical protein
MLFEVLPTCSEECFIYLDKMNRGAAQEAGADLNSLGMEIAAVEKCDDFAEDTGGSHQRR